MNGGGGGRPEPPSSLILYKCVYCLIAKVMHYQTLFTEMKSSDVQFYLGIHFPSSALAAHQSGKVNHLDGTRLHTLAEYEMEMVRGNLY